MDDVELIQRLTAFHREGATKTPPPWLRDAVMRIPAERAQPEARLRSTLTWKGSSVLSAAKLAAAAVVVALLGSFLLVGILTTPQGDEMAPAAVTASPSPMTADELLSGMVTEEVEPGVFRVVNDGYRELAISVIGPGYSVEVGSDGSVWLSREVGGLGLIRLGDESALDIPDDPTELVSPIRIAPDGAVWVIAGFPDERMGIFSLGGQVWTERATTTELLEELVIGPDGTVWVTRMNEGKYCPLITEGGECAGGFLVRLEEDGSLTSIEGWADVHDGDAYPYPLAVSPDGDVWLIGVGRPGDPEAEALLRFDGTEWEAFPLPEGFLNHPPDSALDFGPDGMLWVHAGGFASVEPDLARFDDPGWTLFTVPGGTRTTVPGRDFLVVGDDGGFWLPGKSSGGGCDGVAHYDGTTWTDHLAGRCIVDLAIAPDGSVWLYGEAGTEGHLYVITPEAVSATG